MITKQLTKKSINKAFSDALHQGNYIHGMYERVIPFFNLVSYMKGWPSVNGKTSDYIYGLAIHFDKRFHPDVLAGGGWFNNGFSIDQQLPDWSVSYDPSLVEYDPNNMIVSKGGKR